MKTIKAIQNEITKDINRQKEIESEIEKLSFTQEIHAEAQAKNYARAKELHSLADNNKDQIVALSQELSLLKLCLPIIRENLKAVIASEGLKALTEIIAKYDGKQYGEKTKNRIYEEMKSRGFVFYFDNSSYFDSSSTRIVMALNDGKYHGSTDNVDIHCSVYDNPFITKGNTINAGAVATAHNHYKYFDNVKRQAKAIQKAIEAHKKATETANKTQSALNALIPYDFDHVRNISDSFTVCHEHIYIRL